MAVLVGVIGQKGGVGKSTLARLVAREYANAGWSVKIADLDVSLGTSFNWQGRRLHGSSGPLALRPATIEAAADGLEKIVSRANR